MLRILKANMLRNVFYQNYFFQIENFRANLEVSYVSKCVSYFETDHDMEQAH